MAINIKSLKKMLFTRRSGIRFAIFLLFFVAVCGVYFSVDYLIDYFGRSITSQYEESSRDIAIAYSEICQGLADKCVEQIKFFAEDKRCKTEDSEKIAALIKEKKENNGFPDYFDSFNYVKLNGDVAGSSTPVINISDSITYERIVNGMNQNGNGETRNKVSIVCGVKSKISGKECLIFGYPNLIGEKLVGYFTAEVALSHLYEVFSEIQIGSYRKVCLIDDTGTILMHPDKEYRLSKFKFPEDYRTEQEKYENHMFYDDKNFAEKDYICIENMKKTGWSVAVILPDSNMNYIYYNLLGKKKILTIVFCVVILLLFSVIVFISYITKDRYDQTTSVYSQEFFERRSNRILKRSRSSRFIVIAADIRGLKFINQTYGVDAGNQIIDLYSEQLKKYTRKCHGMCAHSYADHFCILFEVNSISESLDLFTDTIKDIDEAIKIGDFPVISKYGLTIIDPVSKEYDKIRDIKTYIGKALFAKSLIKTKINKAFEIYSSKIEDKIKHEQLIEQEMKKSVQNDEFFVVYQPKINLGDEKIVGAEALVRWRSSNKELGLMNPGKFIPVFEKNGFIEELDFIVYEKVFKFVKTQLELNNPVIPISVNLSRNHITTKKFKEFMERFLNLFHSYNIPPRLIEIEILEQSVTEDSELLIRVIDAFHQEGFSVAMDDFGSGESSLNMLSSIPIDVVKFDQNFLRRQNNEKGGASDVITTLVNLGKVLKKRTVFEGVETEEQRNFLKSIDCDVVQGFFYSKPLEESVFVDFIKEHI